MRTRWPLAPLTLCLAAMVFAQGVQTRAAEEPAAPGTWYAGCAAKVITPPEVMWMSGYSSRDKPAEGTLIDLWAKALYLEDGQGHRSLLITVDLVGVHRDDLQDLRARLKSELGLTPDQIAICSSHTHTGPVFGKNLMAMYLLEPAEANRVLVYADWAKDQIVQVALDAYRTCAPAQLSWGSGQSGFAVNRRNNVEANVPELRRLGQLVGPVDHDVPVLAVRGLDGHLRAVTFGYACHATVLSSFEWSGDYPGFAQLALESQHPGAVALFWAGCGADQNPLPRRTPEIAQAYGNRLAEAVDEVLGNVMQPLAPSLQTIEEDIPLPFDTLPTLAELKEQAQSADRYVSSRAKLLLGRIESGEPLSPTYPYPVQTWSLGNQVHWLFLGGEVVVDYAIRLKQEMSGRSTWVAGYANDVMAYIPSSRVLKEGGYEGGGAMVYYGQPTVWGPTVEEEIIRAAHAQAKRLSQGE